LATGVILLHDGVDLLQDAERMPLWPFSTMEIGRDWLKFSDRLIGELLTFGVPFVAWLVWRKMTGRATLALPGTSARARWATGAYVVAVLLATLGMVHLRREREAQMDRAEELLRAGQLNDALSALDAAEGWPASFGKGDVLRGRVFVRMGDEARAEETFLRAYRNHPNSFWTIAVLAEFYASRGPADSRRTRSAPFVDRLRREFAGDESFAGVIERIDRNLTTDGK
jgi:tetratricopeptide (TPR) repeat protein